MTGEHAGRALAVLTAGFPHDALEPPTAELWLSELRNMQNAAAALDAAHKIVRSGYRFPSLADFRLAYRQAADRMRPPTINPALPQPRQLPPEVLDWAHRNGIRGAA